MQQEDWFYEKTPFNFRATIGIQVRKKLIERTSKYQHIEVYETESVGRMLVLDGIIQLTEFDEFAYHEMFVHVPMMAHTSHVSNVLVIGGGDGGVLRELTRYPDIAQIDICEIDEEVIAISKEFLPFTARGYNDDRVEIHITDGAEFLKKHHGEYDLILVDSPDPIGPAEPLFKRPFYEGLKHALKPNGVALTQCESVFVSLDFIKRLIDDIRGIFPLLQYMTVWVPTYPSGGIGMLICSIGPNMSIPIRFTEFDLKYYNEKIHKAAFCLPRFARLL